MANEIYQQIGTPVSFASAGNVIWTPSNDSGLGFQAGRKSALWDRGASPQPDEYSWRAKVKLQATPVLGESIDFYMATSDGTIIDGLMTAGDAETTDKDALPNLMRIGSLIVDTETTDSIQGSGTFRMYERFGILVAWNNTAAETFTITAADHEFIATPIYYQGQ